MTTKEQKPDILIKLDVIYGDLLIYGKVISVKYLKEARDHIKKSLKRDERLKQIIKEVALSRHIHGKNNTCSNYDGCNWNKAMEFIIEKLEVLER